MIVAAYEIRGAKGKEAELVELQMQAYIAAGCEIWRKPRDNCRI